MASSPSDVVTQHLSISFADYLADERFSRSFTLPADAAAGRATPLTVTYSDFGYRNEADPSTEKVVIFCAPLLSSRFLHIDKDRLAKKYRVRMIVPERPGIGGSTKVPVQDRIKTWLAVVPALLSHLGITHIAALVGQSAGSVYAMNTLLHHRAILDPARPLVLLYTPWIHPRHTNAGAMQLTNFLVPDGGLRHVDSVARLFIVGLGPVTGFSGSVLTAAGRLLKLGSKPFLAEGVDAAEAEWADRLHDIMVARVYEEDVSGLSDETLLLMRRGGREDTWGAWDDYDSLVPVLAAREAELRPGGGETAASDDDRPKLDVRVFYAESDTLVGEKKGPRWFDSCWADGKRGACIEYSSEMVPHTEHDTVLALRFGQAEEFFRIVAGLA